MPLYRGLCNAKDRHNLIFHATIRPLVYITKDKLLGCISAYTTSKNGKSIAYNANFIKTYPSLHKLEASLLHEIPNFIDAYVSEYIKATLSRFSLAK